MQDRVSLYPGRVKLTPVSGQENTYDMVRADEPTQEGDPLSKATFLKDDTAALFGLDATAVPDDAFRKILKAEIIVNAKTGDIVTCTKGTTVLTKTAVDNTCLFIIPEYGEWTVSNGNDAEVVTVDTVKQYYVNLLFNYGDGSKNTVVSGYVGVLQLNGQDATTVSVGSNTSGNYICALYSDNNPGNNDPWKVMIEKATGETVFSKINSGLQMYDFPVDATGQAMSVMHWIGGGANDRDTIGSLKYEVNGAFYTLSELVAEGIIKPLVLIDSCSTNGRYYFKDVLNIYAGGTTTDGSVYPSALIIFMLNRGYAITRSQWYTANGGLYQTSVGWQLFYAPTNAYRLTIKE